MRTIAVINQKGGTAKTTTAQQIGAGLADLNHRVLFVDLDAQQNLTFLLGASPDGMTLADLFQQAIDGKQIQTAEAIQHAPGGDVLASSLNLAAADTILADVEEPEQTLKQILAPIRRKYDFCIIDTPPTLGTLTISALTAANDVIAPAQADVFSLIAIGQLYSTIQTVRKRSNKNLSFTGILLTRFNGRTVISRDTAAQLEDAAALYETKVFKTRIRECSALKEAAIMQQNIFDYAPRSNAAQDYKDLLTELLESE